MQRRLLPCFFPDGVEQPPKQLFPSMRRSNWNPYKWNPFGWGSGGFSSFQFCRNNNHCVIIFMLLLCRAVRQAEIPHNMWKTEQRSKCRWSDGEDIACFITLAQLPACNASAVSHVTILVSVLLAGADSHTHTHTHRQTHTAHKHIRWLWNPTSVQSLIILWVSNNPLLETAGITAAWQSVQTKTTLRVYSRRRL